MTSQNQGRKEKVLISVYQASWHTSMLALSIVCALEIFMLIYTLVNPDLFGAYISIYRTFYASLLTASIIYILLNLSVKNDMPRRYRWLDVANPLYAAFFFTWALGITYFDASAYGAVDPIVFMTFSLTVPLSFYLFPAVYTVIVAVMDILMLYISVTTTGTIGPIINFSFFFIFQIVLGVNFLRLKMRLAERIVQEQENSEIDSLTGLPNRRAYDSEINHLLEKPLQSDVVYIAMDLNALKETNDRYGHETGDKLIIGAAQCIRQTFENSGTMYRTGGDEFVAIIRAEKEELSRLFDRYEDHMRTWSQQNGLALSASYGSVCASECPTSNITEIARLADKKMYEAKAAYYRNGGRDRRVAR